MAYEQLQVWYRAMDLVDLIYRLVRRFPAEERYALSDQLRRAAVSVPANIAEGRGRGTTREFLRFTNIASGSLSERRTLILIADRQNFIDRETRESSIDLIDECARMLNALRRTLKARIATNP